ncbi:PPC domain-containing protein [Paenibacillus sp. MMS18-CY102]|uniref:PPC domain-containing protein n=1 Tax=Paenibacillus sp. MMS18-CY102 TaxID=2682849 RepID=UPI0013665219|nr:PPC domain-containing protein [Paenibacillus sp. MMS18-CY102]MWC27330.1 hypothetical protein [Paenibacillus sp. MMS18-CY102]
MSKKMLYKLLGLLAIISLLQTQAVAFASKGDDSIDQAQHIEVNQSYSGLISESGDANYYHFRLDTAGQVDITMPNVSGKSWNYTLYDSSGKQFPWYNYTSYNELAKGDTVSSVGLPAGDYYISIHRYDGDVYKTPYSFQLKFTPGNTFEKENNDTLTAATLISTNQNYQARLQYNSDVDYYKFTLPKSGKASVILPNVSGVSWAYQLYNSEGKEFPWGNYTDYNELAKGNSISSVGLPAGEYYLRVSRYDGTVSTTPYTLQVKYEAGDTYEKENNDTLSSATPVVVNKTYDTRLQYNNDVDFYKFNLPKSGKLSLVIPNVSGKSWTYQLYDSEGNSFAWYGYTDYNELAKGNTVSSVGLPAGDYYVRISRYDGSVSSTSYSLLLKLTPGDTYEKENNDKLSTATPVSVNKLYEARLQHSSDYDYYKFTLSSKSAISIGQIKGYADQYLYVNLLDSKGNYFDTSSGKVTLAPGTYYLTVNGNSGDYKFKVNAASLPLAAKQVTVVNKKGTSNDTLTVSNIKKGDAVKVYSKQGKLLAQTTLASGTKATLKLTQLSSTGGDLYVSVTNAGLQESGKITVKYSKES